MKGHLEFLLGEIAQGRGVPLGELEVREAHDRGGPLIGRGSQGDMWLLFQSSSTGRRDERFGRIHLVERQVGNKADGRFAQAVVCGADAPQSAVEALFEDLLDRAEGWTDDARLNAGLQRALTEWKSLFSPDEGMWDERKVAGLVGELWHLVWVARQGIADPVTTWAGPTGAAHDFRLDGHHLEVKVSTRTMLSSVHVNNLDQLDPEGTHSLHLSVMHLKRGTGGHSAASLLRQLRRLPGVDHGRLRGRLGTLGFNLDSEWAEVEFLVKGVRVWRINERSPGLRRTAVADSLRQGVSNIEYDLALSALGRPMAAGEIHDRVRMAQGRGDR